MRQKRRFRIPVNDNLLIEDFDEITIAEARYAETARKTGHIDTEEITSGQTHHEEA